MITESFQLVKQNLKIFSKIFIGDNMTCILDKIKELAKNQNITLKELEKNSGLATGSISKWKTSYPTLDKLIKVSNCLNVTLNDIIQQDNLKKEKPPNDEEIKLINLYRKASEEKQDIIKLILEIHN